MFMPPIHATRLALSCAVLALLAACETPPSSRSGGLPKYVSPTGVPVAKLATRASGADLYGTFVLVDADTCGNPHIAAAGRRNGDPPVSVNLAARQWATVEFRAIDQSTRKHCIVRWSFLPAADRTYLLQGSANPTACNARVYDATNPDDIKLEASAVQRNSKTRACLSLAEARELKAREEADNAASGNKDEPLLIPSASSDDLKDLIGK